MKTLLLLWPSTVIRKVPSNLNSTGDIGDTANGRTFSSRFCLSKTGLLEADIERKACTIIGHFTYNVSNTDEATNTEKYISLWKKLKYRLKFSVLYKLRNNHLCNNY